LSSKSLYFLAIIPPDSIEKEVYGLKELVAEKFGSKRSLNSPAHITLIPPFWLETHSIGELNINLEQITKRVKAFTLELIDFDYFEPRVVFVNVKNTEPLGDLYKKLKTVFQNNYNLKLRDDFHPHLTIGFKDLKKQIFYEAKTYFSKLSFHRSFVVDSLYLLSYSSGQWEIVEEYKIN
jgi:2'-5' RNA ligase